MRVLVTGGEGYIGSNLRRFFPASWEFISYDIKSGHDITDFDSIEQAISNVDMVIHLAAVSTSDTCAQIETSLRTNLYATAQIAEVCNVYGIDLLFASSFDPPSTLFGCLKRAASRVVKQLNGRIFYLSHVYGGSNYLRLKDDLIARWVKTLKRDGVLHVYGNGNQTRDFIHVDDACRNIIRFAQSDLQEAFICTGVQTSVNDILNIFRNFCLRHPNLDLKYKYHLSRFEYSVTTPKPSFTWSTSVKDGVMRLLSEVFECA